MSRMIGTVARGVRAPIIRAGDDLAKIVPESVLAAAQEAGFQFHDRDVVAMTEAIVARAQGNYASVDDIAADVKEKLEKAIEETEAMIAQARLRTYSCRAGYIGFCK